MRDSSANIRSKRAGRIIFLLILFLIFFYAFQTFYISLMLKNDELQLANLYQVFFGDKSKIEIYIKILRNIIILTSLSILGFYFLKAKRLAYLILLTWTTFVLGQELLEYFITKEYDMIFYIKLLINSTIIFALLQKDLREIFINDKK